jgi:aminoglycoside phosphotransferase family enzyme/predicted kinase
LELNRRLAPDVYLGVVEVTGVDGRPCEHVVVMRRMPEERRLATLLGTGVPLDGPVRALARMLAAFHANARRDPQITAEGGREALRARWTDSFGELQRFRGTVLDDALVAELERRALRFLDGRAPLLAARQRAGRIVDGHGDLLTGDIFILDDGPRVLDCLEFDDRLRYLDGLDDAAFLAMDLEYRGAAELGSRFLDWYAEFAGDPAPLALRHHYIAYRAVVRAKVACLRSEQGDVSVQDKSREQAQRYADIAARHLRAAEVRLVLVGGLPGTGKSTVSDALAGELGMVVLSSDRVRKELHGLAPHQSAAAPYQQGLYSPAATERTYTELLARAGRCLVQGESVVLDASWTQATHRAAAAELARSARHTHRAAMHRATRSDHPATAGTHRVHLRCRRGDRPCPCSPRRPVATGLTHCHRRIRARRPHRSMPPGEQGLGRLIRQPAGRAGYSEAYPELPRDGLGMRALFRQFSFPGGVPSHVALEVPGSIHEGGELGYSLAHAYGAAFDNPELLVACVVGDGETETGPLATSWHASKFLDPVHDGAVPAARYRRPSSSNPAKKLSGKLYPVVWANADTMMEPFETGIWLSPAGGPV